MIVDAGDLFRRSAQLPDAERVEREAKARLIAELTRAGGVDAMMPARGDFAFGRAFVEGLAAEFDLPYVLSNVECERPLPFPSVRRFDKGGAKVEVYGLAGPELALEGCTVTDPGQALEKLPADDTVVIVLADLGRMPEADVARRSPGIDLIVRSDAAETLSTPEALPTGGLVLSNGSRGKLLGVAEIELTPGAPRWADAGAVAGRAADVDSATRKLKELADRKARATEPKEVTRLERQEEFWKKKLATAEAGLAAATSSQSPAHRVKNTLRGLGDDVGEHEPTLTKVKALKSTLTGTASAPPTPQPAANAAGMGNFVGSAACAACHAVQSTQWATTGHARAYASLIADDRQYDRDCFTCHVTGAFDRTGPTDPRALGGLENVGCESCHGAGKAHVASPATAPLVKTPPAAQCVQCHDSRQDGGRFVESTYRPRVVH